MKFIHTADWHLGNSMHDIDRREEAKRFLDWLRERIVDFGAECLVVAGYGESSSGSASDVFPLFGVVARYLLQEYRAGGRQP